jgi:hypothetical protein
METKEKALSKFKPLTEEEQKDVLFIIADCMDFYTNKMMKVKTIEDLERYRLLYETYCFFCNLLTDDPEWFKEIGLSGYKFALDVARKDRLEYEAKKRRRKA